MLTAPPLALKLTAERNIDFDDAFTIQFLLSKNPNLEVGKFHRKSAGDWTLYHGKNLPVLALNDQSGALIGYFLGIGVDEHGQLVTDKFGDAYSLNDADFVESIEESIAKIAGRYIVILINIQCKRIYFDPCATLGVVFDEQTKTVASSVTLCLDRDIIDNPNFENNAVLSGKDSYLLQQTSDKYIKLIIANHFLNLDDFSLTRHWPKPEQTFTAKPEEYDALAKDIIERLSDIFGVIVKNHETIVAISGGADSRNIIAAAKDHLKDVKLFFTFGHNFMSRNDMEVAAIIADFLDVPFKGYDAVKDENHEIPKGFKKRQMHYRYRITSGFSYPTPPEIHQDLQHYLPKGAVHFRGNLIDLLKSKNYPKTFFSVQSDAEHREAELRGLFLGTPSKEALEKYMPAYMAWFKTLPENAHPVSYDMKYMELLWPVFSQIFYGLHHTFYLCPFSDRRLITNALRFPVSYRRGGNAVNLVLNTAMPELANIPFLRQHIARKKKH